MLETILLLLITAVVFGLFFLVFLLKGTSAEKPARFHTCGDCDCHRSKPRSNLTTLSKSPDEPCRSDPARAS